ncbi:MAG: hypothetical protein MJ252_30390 [archaeon]|nr:hypothetical protein [archaeon]
MSDQTIYIILLIFNVVIYLACCYLIIKRKEYSCISIRSPTLLLFNNIGGFLVTTTLIVVYLNSEMNGDKNFFRIPVIYYIAETLMMGSFFMRCQRILACCQITDNEQYDKDEFSKKRYLYGEKRYVRLLGFAVILIAIVVIVLMVIKYDCSVPNMIFNDENEEKENGTCSEEFRLAFFIVYHFVILIGLITYTYFLIINEAKQKILFEAIGFTICIFLFMNGQTALDVFTDIKDSSQELSESYKRNSLIVCLIIFYLCLGLNGYFPVTLSYCYKTSIAYHFNPQLMNNLYLFLSNEECYGTFSEYIKDDEETSFYLRVYTHIMKFKLEFLNGEDPENCSEEAKEILETYFKGNKFSGKFDTATQEKINSLSNEDINRENTKAEMFDLALKYSFEQLSNKFLDFKNTVQFEILRKNLAMQSYIQCKMSNTGLINKY